MKLLLVNDDGTVIESWTMGSHLGLFETLLLGVKEELGERSETYQTLAKAVSDEIDRLTEAED